MPNESTCTAFADYRCVASGAVADVALAIKQTVERDARPVVLVFDDQTASQVELDLRGSVEDVVRRFREPDYAAERASTPRHAGRPKLGVVSREVTLLPRHWEWLNDQPGGASVALRKLVEEARRANAGRDRVRHAQEVTYRFMSAIAGNLPGYEEAARALFAGDAKRFDAQIASWPADVSAHAAKLAAQSFSGAG